MEHLREDSHHPGLADLLGAIFSAVADIANLLRTPNANETGGVNLSGDKQLMADVESDRIMFDALRQCGTIASACSEETSTIQSLNGSDFSVAFDPLDGSSIVAANWSVGTIIGIWPGDGLLGRTGREQVAAVYAVYGPRTTIVIARPSSAADSRIVQEFVLQPSGSWTLTRSNIRIGEENVFAPANLRSAADNAAYRQLVHHWINERLTLRYSGGMVPDVHHIVTAGGGVFCSPASSAAKAKLRLLYECAPLAFIVEAAGGASHDGNGSVLDQQIGDVDMRSIISLGSPALVQASVPALQGA